MNESTVPEGFPRGVVDPLCPDEHVLTESTDRRLLWHLELQLAGANTERLRDTGSALRRYLHTTCQHHWHDYLTCCDPPNDGCVPAHRQCLWCHDVVWLDEEQR
jgi:hypothetical protein